MDTQEKEAQSKQHPIKTIRNGAIAANIWERQTPTGYGYLDFSISRSWKLKDGQREGYSSSFFETNEAALLEVITKASEFIRTHNANASLVNGESKQKNGTRAENHAGT